MRALIYIGTPQKLEWQEKPDPVVQGPLEAVVKPLAAAACDLDAVIAAGKSLFPAPLPMGHECVARVERIGDAVRTVKAGDIVTVPFQISCGQCVACKRGHTGNCKSVPGFTTYGMGVRGAAFGGVFADLVRVPFADGMLVPVPPEIPPATLASLSDNIPDAWRAVAPVLGENPNATVLIVGSRSIGLYAAACAVALGAPQVDYVDTDADRLERARRVGANAIEGQPDKKIGRYSLTIDASGTEKGLRCALSSLKFEGTCYGLSLLFNNETSVPLMDMYVAGVTFRTGRCHARPSIPPILDLVKQGRLHPELITSKTVTWDDLPGALIEAGYTKLVAIP
jgi:threonine dehydrogenase-like Zn-dependent dehydrogenase